MWFIGVEEEQEMSAPPPKKILDPPLHCILLHAQRGFLAQQTSPEKENSNLHSNSLLAARTNVIEGPNPNKGSNQL